MSCEFTPDLKRIFRHARLLTTHTPPAKDPILNCYSSVRLGRVSFADLSRNWGLPRCKNLTRFSLFVSFCFAVRYCLKCFCFLCFTSSVSFTGSYTEVKPEIA